MFREKEYCSRIGGVPGQHQKTFSRESLESKKSEASTVKTENWASKSTENEVGSYPSFTAG